jgi:hypothetical protein
MSDRKEYTTPRLIDLDSLTNPKPPLTKQTTDTAVLFLLDSVRKLAARVEELEAKVKAYDDFSSEDALLLED